MDGIPSLKILVVDDDKVVRLTLKAILDYLGHEVEEAADGASGLVALRRNLFDAAISDIVMPGLDGFEFLAEAKKLRPDLPILLISGHEDDTLAVNALNAGAVAFYRKPVKIEDLKRLLASLRPTR